MKVLNIKSTIHLVLSLLLGSTSFTSSANVTELEVVRVTEEIVSNYRENNWFSGSVAIKKGENVLYNNSFGFADIPEKIENTPQTKIRIGSINKHYTAVLVLQKVQSGQLSLDDRLAKFSLGFPEEIGNQVTIRHLLNHTSGFEDIFNEEYIKTYRSLLDIDAKLPLLMNKPLISEPGTKYNYSNYGYIVLGAVIEKIEQKPFKQIIESNIFRKIGTNDTHYELTDLVPGKARSYRHNDDGSKADKTDILENVTPDGGMYSTPEDIATFYSSLFYSDKLLNDKYKAVLVNDFQDSTKTWSKLVSKRDAQWRSYGGAPGVSAAAEVLFKDRLIIVVLANTDGLVAEKISQEIVSAYKNMSN